jgi:CRISPR-associated endonuclease Csy4
MDAYLDIALLPGPEFAPTLLMNALFAKLHRALVARGAGDIGVSFPEAGPMALGGRLRLHGRGGALAELMAADWLAGMRDHIRLGGVGPVPGDVRHRVVRRVQAKSNPERLRRRLVARKGIDAEAARRAIPDGAAERLSLPYLELSSQSTGQRFRLFVEHLPVQDQAVDGTFSAYGLSPSATVPWFWPFIHCRIGGL